MNKKIDYFKEYYMLKRILLIVLGLINISLLFAQSTGSNYDFTSRDREAIQNGYTISRIFEDGQLIETYTPTEQDRSQGRESINAIRVTVQTSTFKPVDYTDDYIKWVFNDQLTMRRFFKLNNLSFYYDSFNDNAYGNYPIEIVLDNFDGSYLYKNKYLGNYQELYRYVSR
jgi:hypothetical protein